MAQEDETQEQEPFNYDDILDHIGQFGRYQLRSFIPLCFPAFFFGIVIMSTTFTAAIPLYRCYIDGCENRTSIDFQPSWLNNTIPWDDENLFIAQCFRYNRTWSDLDECQLNIYDDYSLQECNEWIYDESVFHSTIVTEFDLTCDNEWQQAFVNTVYMVGMLVGAFVMGGCTDLIGRKISFFVSTLILASAMTGCALAPDVLTFTILRFFCGMADVGFFMIIFVWGVEAVGQKYRAKVGFFYNFMTSVGSVCLGVVAYFVRDWKSLQLIISVPMFLLLSVYWIVPESTRWLISKRRRSEALSLIIKAAKINGKSVPPHLLAPPVEVRSVGKVNGTQERIIDSLRSPTVLKHLIIMVVTWVGTLIGYYGVTFSAVNLSGDFHLNYLLFMTIEFPCSLFGVISIERLGRRATCAGGLIFGGIFCLTTGLVPKDIEGLRIATSLIGKFFITCVLATIYSYTAELFPTSFRSTAMGICITLSKVGGVIAPSIVEMGRTVNQSFPYVIFAIVNIVVGLLCLALPETSGVTLPATIEDTQNLKKFTLTKNCCRTDLSE